MWGWRIKEILRSRLPERFSGTLPRLLIEIAVGAGLIAVLASARLVLVPVTGEAAPYAFVFAAVVGAAVLAGWRSGLIALVLGQALVWVFVVGPQGRILGKAAFQAGGLLVATIFELLILAIIALYQREVTRASLRLESERGLLEKALREIDHRTSNNYQTVLALVLSQAKSAKDGAVRDALQQVADRIRAIANVSRRLAVASESLERVRIADHLHDLCGEIERGLSRPVIGLECKFDDLVLDADEAVCVSILVNELVTNALKHAFPGDRAGTIRIGLARQGNGLELRVEDDGVGIGGAAGNRGTGLGRRLVDTFVKQLDAGHKVESGGTGTRHRISIPA